MINADQYLNLITSQHRQKEKFVRTVSISANASTDLQNLMLSMIEKFDLDNAEGEQLDFIGKWVGLSRNISVPISGVYFSWDSTFTLGWDYGSWRPSNEPAEITSLPDDAYKTLIRAKIAANKWDGTTSGAYRIWAEIFPNFNILIQDNQDMTYALAIVGGVVDSLTLALLTGGYLPLKPQCIAVTFYYVSTGSDKVFAWDVDSSVLGGWDDGSWVREILA